MNRYAAIALTTAALFLVVMAILVASPPLFYMATGIMATLVGSRLQAWLSIRYLRFERHAPPAVKIGEPVTVQITVMSERKLKRPLVTVVDGLPGKLRIRSTTPSLPVAPSYDQPIRTQYTFTPMRRGRFSWKELTVYGTDALGLSTLNKSYDIDPVELSVYPAPIPVSISISPTGGWGLSELESGKRKGTGLEPRGIREYVTGDPIRTIHWKSTAKTGNLMVKEFETGSGVSLKMMLQRTQGTDLGDSSTTTFEAMCGHALYLADEFLDKGASITFPQMEAYDAMTDHPDVRARDIRDVLTDIQPDAIDSLSDDLTSAANWIRQGDTILMFLSTRDDALPATMLQTSGAQFVCLIYDPAPYFSSSKGPASPASNPEYIGILESAGAQVIPMPFVENLI
jgi:uncharacterized protein (DUF58 family)